MIKLTPMFIPLIWVCAAYCYRISVKSTSIIWIPLLYVVYKTYDSSLTVHDKLEDLRDSSLWQLVRLLSWVTLTLFLAKLLLLPNIIGWWNAQPWSDILDVYVMPNLIHPWHLAAAINAVIALGGYYYLIEPAPRNLRRHSWSDHGVNRILQAFTFVRGSISIYTISVGVWLTLTANSSILWPRWSWSILPR